MATKTKSSSTKTTKSAAKKTVKKTAPKKVVKKAAPKKAVKKPVKKAAPKKKAAKKASKKILPEQYFYLNDGNVIKDIKELAKMMDELSDEIFYHHVNEEKHDFANWLYNVFEEAELAEQLFNAERNKEKNHYIVLRYVVKGK